MAKDPEKMKTPEKSTAPASKSGDIANPLVDLRDEMDRLFDRFSTRFPSLSTGRGLFDWEPLSSLRGPGGLEAPTVDVTETEKGFEFTADLPGVSEKDISVELKDDVLTVSGEKKEETEKEEKDYRLSERRFGSFRRSFRLPAAVDDKKVKATFKDGVLNISLPKTADAQKDGRKIKITSG